MRALCYVSKEPGCHSLQSCTGLRVYNCNLSIHSNAINILGRCYFMTRAGDL